MENINYHYDKEGDVLYISFGRSDHVIGVELGDHLLLRLDTGDTQGKIPHAIGLTVLFPGQLLALGQAPAFTLEKLEQLPVHIRAAVFEVLSKPPVSELLSVRMTLIPDDIRLPELAMA